MRRLLLAAVWLATLLGAFWAGHHWTDHRFLGATRYVTTQPLTLYANGDEDGPPGVLPKGVTLYDLGGPDEFPHFVLIIGTKALTTLSVDASERRFSRIPAEAALESLGTVP